MSFESTFAFYEWSDEMSGAQNIPEPNDASALAKDYIETLIPKNSSSPDDIIKNAENSFSLLLNACEAAVSGGAIGMLLFKTFVQDILRSLETA